MQYFLASDVLYRLAAGADQHRLCQTRDINEKVPDSVFLPDPSAGSTLFRSRPLWPRCRRQGDAAAPTAWPCSRPPSSPGDMTPRPEHAGDDQRQRDRRRSTSRCRTRATAEENDVGGQLPAHRRRADDLRRGTIPRLAAGSIQTASIPLQPTPGQTDVQLTLEVTVQPVPGEQIANNNRSTYTVTFS